MPNISAFNTEECLSGHRQVERPLAWRNLRGRISALDDDVPRPFVYRLSLPGRSHKLRGLALLSVPVELVHGRGDAGGPRRLGHLRDDPAMGPEIRSRIRQPDPSASPGPRRQMAPR